MRILHINCNYIGTTLHQLMIEKMEGLGYDNSVFVPTYNKNLSVIKPNKNVVVCECFKKVDRVLFDYKQTKIFKALEKCFAVKDYDLIHAYTLFTDGNCARKLSEKYNIPYVVAVRNTDVNSFFRFMPHLRMRGIKTMLGAKAVFFLSESYKNQVFEKYVPEKYYVELKKKSFVIPNGIDEFWLKNPPAIENKIIDEVRLIYAGRIDRNKNITSIQKAMEVLRTRGYKASLTVVGKVFDKGIFKEIKKYKSIRYFPPKSKEDLLDLYREHNIFVMPSFTETFGLVYAEAMSQGLPVVYTKGQGFDGHFPDGEVGCRVLAHDVDNIADGIEWVINNFDDIKKRVVELSHKFSWDELSKIYDKVYRM